MSAHSETLLQALDIMLAERYHIYLSEPLRNHLQSYDADDLLQFWTWFEDVWRDAGKTIHKEINLTPMVSQFPNHIPDDMHTLWLKRYFSLFGTQLNQTVLCSYCHSKHTRIELEPCHHMVCSNCFNGYTGCPLCGHPIDSRSTFLKQQSILYRNDRGAWETMKRLDLGTDIEQFAKDKFLSFCQVAQAQSSQEQLTLRIIMQAYPEKLADWFPEKFASKQAQALVLHTFMQYSSHPDPTVILKKYLKNATDVLRLISVMSGEPGTLMPHHVHRSIPISQCDEQFMHHLPKWGQRLLKTVLFERQHATSSQKKKRDKIIIDEISYQFTVVKMTRRTRRLFLSLLESFNQNSLIEDFLRHKALWIRVGEFLHPGDYKKRFPKVSRAFMVIRKHAVSASEDPSPVRYKTWRSRLEEALASRDSETLKMLMTKRPGEFARHLDRILRGFVLMPNAVDFSLENLIQTGADICLDRISKKGLFQGIKSLTQNVGTLLTHARRDSMTKWTLIHTLNACVNKLSTPMLIQLWGHFGTRHHPLNTRLFYPAGTTRKIYWRKDTRPPIHAIYIKLIRRMILKVLLSRFEQKKRFAQSILDSSLQTLTFPFNERSNESEALQLSPGSSLNMPPEEKTGTIRLFLHWCEKAKGVSTDLDLSVAFFDEDWVMRDSCTYYHLQCASKTAPSQFFAKHSGDFRHAPFPRGATEYVDINRGLALKEGIRYACVFVQVYAGIDFSTLERAFTGVMFRHDTKNTAYFDPQTVRFKYALNGTTKSYIPLIFDLQSQTVHDIQCYLPSRQTTLPNNLHNHKEALKALVSSLMHYYADRPRPMRSDIALMHAAARSSVVWIRLPNGHAVSFKRNKSDSVFTFYHQILKGLEHLAHQPPTENDPAPWSAPTPMPPTLAFLMDGDIALPDESEYYLILSGELNERFSWSDLIT